MKKILKRLELISSAIDLEENEMIEEQVAKLRELSIDNDVQEILKMIEDKRYEHVISSITTYVHRFSGVTVYEDPQIQGLRVELSILEKELNSLSESQNEYLAEINAFTSDYYRHLGAVIEEILRLQQEVAQKSYDKGKIDEEELKASKDEYKSFYEEAITQSKEQPFSLTEEEEKELKKLYRKASRLTHPDTVADAFKEEATKIFIALNSAYKRKDLAKVKEIFVGLESGTAFAYGSDEINDKELLRKKSEVLREKIKVIIKEIEELMQSDTYITIKEIDDLDAYFDELKENLIVEKEALVLELLKV
ncbi:MAG: Unknown protein [uncultured Sulfurovum sp.]|uniref:J domain-containing protein n=1 Tax=uncultured Sulfurovum sp. TaxID=269237 RepID=A0A6S6RV09_9BACT|nr:MAG: Unknown protein [uncultured Sulfurovum sp.]